MFSDLFKLVQKPVTVFSSDDKDSPVLTNEPGALKTLLKACLVTGYANKAGLGWQLKFDSEDATKAVFVSADPTSSQFHLKIDNSEALAKLSVYQSMTAFDSGQRAMVQDRTYLAKAGSWRLIGHEKAFILLTDSPVSNQGDTRAAWPLIFGDLPAQTRRIAPSVVFWCAYPKNNADSWAGVGGVQSTLFYNRYGYERYYNNRDYKEALCYPFTISTGAGGEQLTTAACRFDYASHHGGVLLFEPILFTLGDGTWSFLPMVLPLSNLSPVGNLGAITDTLLLARTGWYAGAGNNNDCGVPTDFWWA